jgi:hypothetical protein
MNHLPLLRASLLAAALAAPFALPLPALASHVGEEVTLDAEAVAATTQLVRALGNWERTPAAQRSAATARLVQLAQARQERLIRLLDRAPELAASRLLPAGVRDRLPAEARAFAEEDVRLSGEVVGRVADDFARGVARTDVLLRLSNSAAVLQLYLATTADRERTLLGWLGRRATLAGTRIEGRLLVQDSAAVTLVAADGTETTTSTSTPTMTPKVSGVQKTLVILANFSDAALSCTAADVGNRVFGSTGSTVNTSFRESSRDLVGFTGMVAGPFAIPYSASASTCDYGGWASAADAAARSAGIDLTQYQRVSYVTPKASACGWGGLAYMPGRQSWVQYCGSTGIYTHELGHNLSLHHAGTPTAEYGDGSDPMGGARNVRNNAANQVMAGWLPTGSVVDVFAGGSYAVAALDAATASSAQVLRLVKPDTNERYYVSLRQAIGLDSGLPYGALNTLSIHRATGTLPARTTLLQNLSVGQTFSDATNGIQVTHQALAGNVSTVGIAFSGSTCTRAAPTLTLNPASTSGGPGMSRSLSVAVKNNNTAACGTSSFALTQALPAGFGGTVSTTSLAIAAGATASASWTVTPAAGTPEGSYTLDLSANDGGGASATAHAGYTVIVDAGGPALTVTNPAEGARIATSTGRLSLTASASDSSGVAAVEFWVDGKLLVRDTSAPYGATWNIRKASKTGHAITVRAVDALGNSTSQTVNVTLY